MKMTNNQDYLNQLFEAARNETPIVSVDKICSAVEAHAAVGLAVTASGKFSFLTLKNGLIGFVATGVIAGSVAVFSPKTVEEVPQEKTVQKVEMPPISEEVTPTTNTPEPIVEKVETPTIATVVDSPDVEEPVPAPAANIDVEIGEDEVVILVNDQKVVVDDASDDVDGIVSAIRLGLRKRYFITEKTTEEELKTIIAELKKDAGIKMTYNNLRFSNNKLLRFAIELKKGRSMIRAHHSHQPSSSYIYEFGWKMNENGKFIDFYTISCHEQDGHVCAISNDCELKDCQNDNSFRGVIIDDNDNLSNRNNRKTHFR